MGAVWMRARAEMRGRWRAWLGLALLITVFFGPCLSAIAGARRTTSTYSRFRETHHAWDVMILDGSIFAPILWKPDFCALERLPYIESSARMATGGFRGGISFIAPPQGTTANDCPNHPRAPHPAEYGITLNRATILSGRLPRPGSTDEIALSVFQRTDDADPVAAKGLRRLVRAPTGSSVTIVGPGGKRMTLKVVGRIVSPFDFRPNENDANALVSAAFVARLPRGDESYVTDSIALRFRHAGDLQRFQRDLKTLTNGKVVVPIVAEANTNAVTYSARLQGTALFMLAAFAGLTAILLLAQTLTRQTFLDSVEYPALRALGMGREQTFALGMLRTGAIATLGALLAALFAFATSPVFPFGVFRFAEPSPGLRFDALPMIVGPFAIVAFALCIAAIPAWRSATVSDRSTQRPSRSAALVATWGMPASAVAGVRLALERGRGRTAVPVRSTLTVVTIGIAAVVAALTLSSSIALLLDSPRLYGKTWDSVINRADSGPLGKDILDAVVALPGVEAAGAIDTGAPLTIDGRRVGALTIGNIKGSLYPPIVEGRAPRGPDDLVLGTKTLRALHKRIDLAHPATVRVGLEGLEKTVIGRVVGRAVIPPIGDYARFGEGVNLSSNFDLQPILENNDEPPVPSDLVVRFRPGSNPRDVIRPVLERFKDQQLHMGETLARRPSDVVDFGRVRGIPLILAGLLAFIGAAALAHAVATAVYRKSRDLAILKTLGFVRGQVRRAVAWQASTFVAIALLFGIPLGIIAGRALWSVFADTLGVVRFVSVPELALLLLAPAALVLGNLIAAIPARAAARTPPALVLRTE